MTWLFFNVGYGAIIGQLVMLNPIMRKHYMDLFFLWGYALFYTASFIIKTEYDNTNLKPGEVGPVVSEKNLNLNIIASTYAGLLYGTGLLKLGGYGRYLPNMRLIAMLFAI